jgi:hypothetical protein
MINHGLSQQILKFAPGKCLPAIATVAKVPKKLSEKIAHDVLSASLRGPHEYSWDSPAHKEWIARLTTRL